MPVFNNILAGSSGQGDTGYDIDQSLRLDDGDSAFLSKAYASSGNRKTWTFSCWVKRAETSSGAQPILSSDFGPTWAVLEFLAGDNLTFNDYTPSGASYQSRRETTALYRDVGAWYHIVVRYDTTDSTAGDRLKLYVNGEQVTDFANSTDPSLNYDGNINYGNGSRLHGIGKQTGSGDFYDGYLAEVNFIDGQALTPASFGETNSATNQWVPIEVTGMTYGTNGFYLPFSSTELATSFTDSSSSSHTITANASASHTVAKKKIGRSSITTPTTASSYLTVAASSDFNFTTNPFTFECWFYTDNVSSSASFAEIARYNPSGNGWSLWYYLGDFVYSQDGASTTSFFNRYGGALTANTWHHVAMTVNNTEARLYLNGSNLATIGITAPVNSGSAALRIGSHNTNVNYWMDEIRLSDSLRYTSNFTPSTTAFTADANTLLLIHSDFNGGLGADSSGNKNDFSATNLVATDQVLDSPTRNYCTLNPLETRGTITLSEGNLKGITGAGDSETRGTIAIPQSGKWYWEFCMLNSTSFMIGVIDYQHGGSGDFYTSNKAVLYSSGAGTKYNFSSVASYGATWTTGDIMGVAFNRDDNQITFYKNNSAQPTLTIGGTADERARLIPIIGTGTGGTAGGQLNFGADSSFAGNKTAQGNGDDGEDFYYTPPTGYKALNTNNLDDPAIALPGDHFNSILWTGDATSPRSFTGVGFTPDLVWTKNRTTGVSHMLYDTVRGAGSTKSLESNASLAEGGGNQATYGYLSAFGSDGFTTTDGSGSPNYYFNENTKNFVAWNWKAGGTAVSNGDGSITSSVSANPTAGFSIVSYTGTGANATVGHGLSQTPELIIFKNLPDTEDWIVYSEPVGSGGGLFLNHANATDADGLYFNSTSPTSSVFTVGSQNRSNGSSNAMIAYAFHSIEGYSKVGTYEGNNNADGTFIYTGFKPAFLMYKSIDTAYDWGMVDNKRNTYNTLTKYLAANENAAEITNSFGDFTSNGIKMRNTYGGANAANTYMYIAFAESPFKYSNAR